MKARITKTTIEKLARGQAITDTEVRGFRARRLPSGVVTYDFRYRTPAGQKFVSLGAHGSITAEEARRLAKKCAGQVADHRDPVAERKAQRQTASNTVDAVLDNYIKRDVRGRGLRSIGEIQRAFDRLIRPKIGDRSIYDLKKSDIAKLFDAIADNSGLVMADRTLAYLRAAFNWQAARDDDFRSPIVKGMARTKPSERKRDRILDDQEIADVWRALNEADLPDCYPGYVRALLFSAQRKANVAKISSDEIQGDRWVIPGARMKHKKDHLVPITPVLGALFGDRKGYLFSTDGGATPFGGFGKAKAALDAKIAAIRKAEGRKPMPHWTQHDLRRTARSIMSRYTTPDIAERVIGHVIPGVRGVYDLYEYADEKRVALEKLATHIEGVIRPQPDVVVSFQNSGAVRSPSTRGRTSTIERAV